MRRFESSVAFAQARKWRASLRAARKSFHEQLTRIDLEYLPLFVLTLNRKQLAAAYTLLYRKVAPAKSANLANLIVAFPNRQKILFACRRAKHPLSNGRLMKRVPKRECDSLDQDVRQVFGVLYRFDPRSKSNSLAQRKRTKERDAAKRRAWWARMTSEQRQKYIADQWKRREARLKADQKVYEAYKEQKRLERVARAERINRDPIAKAKEAARIKESNRRRPYQDRMRQIKQNPDSLAKYKVRMRRGQRKYRLKRELQDPQKQAALMRKVNAALPRTFPPELREDLRQELLLAVMSGEATTKDLAGIVRVKARKARKLIAETWGQRSLNEPIRGTDGLTLLDTLSTTSQRF